MLKRMVMLHMVVGASLISTMQNSAEQVCILAVELTEATPTDQADNSSVLQLSKVRLHPCSASRAVILARALLSTQ